MTIPRTGRLFLGRRYNHYIDFYEAIRDAERGMQKPATQMFSERSISIAWNLLVTKVVYPYTNNLRIGHMFFADSFGYSMFSFRQNTKLISEIRKIFMHINEHIRLTIDNLTLTIKNLPVLNIDNQTPYIRLNRPQQNGQYVAIQFIQSTTPTIVSESRIEIPEFFKNPFQGLNSEAIFALTNII